MIGAPGRRGSHVCKRLKCRAVANEIVSHVYHMEGAISKVKYGIYL